MHPYFANMRYLNQPVIPYPINPYIYPNPIYNEVGYSYDNNGRQQAIKGQATWTEGGQVTICDIPWSDNEYMTAAVGEDSPYQCGDTIKIRNVSAPVGREILVKVVDQVAGYPSNRINLHRRAFQALGVNPNVGVFNIEILPYPQLEVDKWGNYLMEVTQTAYPGYNITNYAHLGKSEISASQTKESFEFILQSPQETIRVQGNVIYNPNTDRIVSFDIKEI